MHWSQAAIKRAAVAIRESYSTDTYVMARRALEAAIRSEVDLMELLTVLPAKPAPQRPSVKNTSQAATASHAQA
jgi:hypothetical protein